LRVLLVEDEPQILRVISKGLRENAYAVDVAADGAGALYLAEINDYDLIILDVMLPVVDGFEVCRTLRERGKETPVLMLTARGTVEDRIEGLDSGADDYLTKPFSFRELLARMRALLRRNKVIHLDRYTISDLVIDTRSQSVVRSGNPISLTTKEYALLEFLARNAGRVVGRAEIAQHVWDENFDPFSNVIEVHMNRLRRKIEINGPALIQTRRGAGYVLAEPDIATESN
jgi:two-component system copper resistance phosphate regulon response regulator CusR